MQILYYTWMPILVSSIVLYSASNTAIETCPCPEECDSSWRGDQECDIECNFAACHWDNGDCDPRGHYDGRCIGNATIINRDTRQEIKGSCDEWAKMRRTCEDSDHLGLYLPWQLQTDDCRWVMNAFIPRPTLGGGRCHSLIPCVSDQWCQANCEMNIKNNPTKCAWDPPKPIWIPTPRPTKKPTKQPSKRPTRRRTKRPTPYPTKFPSRYPTKKPTLVPTNNPTNSPTNNPTNSPTNNPTPVPTKVPTRTSVLPPHTHITSPPAPIIHHTTNNTYGAHPAVTIVAILVVAIIIIVVVCLYYKRQRYKENLREINARRLANQALYASSPTPTITIQDTPIIRGRALSEREGIELAAKRITKG